MPALKTAKAALNRSSFAGPAAIYVHWPFCEKKCPYCDFNSHVREKITHQMWRDGLVQEIRTFAAYHPNLSAKSIFFGGGTPSLMEPETVAAVIAEIHKVWKPANALEITLEANPSSVEAGRFRAYRDAGVNRLSVGIQSLKDEVLKFLGRLHNAEEALKALKVAQTTFDRVSFDLIYALPEQTLAGWQTELKEALSFGTSHLSLYQLTIEEGTAFYQQFNRGKFTLPDEDLAANLYDITQNITARASLPAYETSNHAQHGMESVHNLAYWEGDYYVGIGPGAHGRLPGKLPGSADAHAQIKRPEDWLSAVQQHGVGLDSLETVSALDRAEEAIMTGLRLAKGVDLPTWRSRFGQSEHALINTEQAAILAQSGHLVFNDTLLQLTPKGQPLLNHILGKLIA
ncbi:radical SAM family heme chaperone HemW [Kordiimonas pumila]|uniref:Heme chaperone HemW n=1 Tax=Kordiimonas pumila TaxID=2161677 RepID=A0ABV7DAP7_9PROT|nr:radical SAM family heme chaperone HemW [Kordiimonas pumila]